MKNLPPKHSAILGLGVALVAVLTLAGFAANSSWFQVDGYAGSTRDSGYLLSAAALTAFATGASCTIQAQHRGLRIAGTFLIVGACVNAVYALTACMWASTTDHPCV